MPTNHVWILTCEISALDLLTAASLVLMWSSRFVPTSHRSALYFCTLGVTSTFAIIHVPLPLFYSHPDTSITKSALGSLKLAQSVLSLLVLVTFAVTPRVWRPLDPYDPDARPSVEQEASFFSLVVSYGWLKPILRRAWRVDLEPEDLPRLRDCDTAEVWSEKLPAASSPNVHRALNMIHVFAPDLAKVAFVEVVNSAIHIVKPILLLPLLRYFEAGRDLRSILFAPWFYILCIGLSSTLEMITKQAFFFFELR